MLTSGLKNWALSRGIFSTPYKHCVSASLQKKYKIVHLLHILLSHSLTWIAEIKLFALKNRYIIESFTLYFVLWYFPWRQNIAWKHFWKTNNHFVKSPSWTIVYIWQPPSPSAYPRSYWKPLPSSHGKDSLGFLSIFWCTMSGYVTINHLLSMSNLAENFCKTFL